MYDPHRHHRRSVRLPDVTYADPGGYFITICVEGKVCLFGDVVDAETRLNDLGRIVCEEWSRTAIVRPHVELDAFVVMPNHLHGIIIIRGDGSETPDENTSIPVGATRWVALHPDVYDAQHSASNDLERNRPSNRVARTADPTKRATHPAKRATHPAKRATHRAKRATHRVAPTNARGPERGSVGAMVGQFKSIVTRRINLLRGTPGVSVWQRNYHEHIIRNGRDLDRIRQYIAENPARWRYDRYFDAP